MNILNRKIYSNLFLSVFLIKGFFNIIESILRNLSGPFGLLIRRFYYRFSF